MNILMLSSTFPYPPSRGGTEVRTFNLLKYLQQRHHVTLVTQLPGETEAATVEALRREVKELVLFPRPSTESLGRGLGGKLKRFQAFVAQGTPPNVLYLYSAEIQDWVDRQVQSGQCEVITCEHSVNEIYVRPELRQRVRTVVNIHSSVYGSCRSQLAAGISAHPWRDRINLPLLRRYEQRYCQKFSDLVVTTDDDRRQIQAFNLQSRITVIPNGVDLTAFPYRSGDPGGHQLIFTGAMDSLPNIDAARFLALELLPEVRQRYPDASLVLAGARPTPEVLALGSIPGVMVTGPVPQMVDVLHRATVCVIAMRTGFGIKNKTLEAMAAGIPIVGSDRGLEGLPVDTPGVPVRALRANQLQEYVTAICQLFASAELREQLSRQGRAFVESDYTWERAGKLYEQVIEGM